MNMKNKEPFFKHSIFAHNAPLINKLINQYRAPGIKFYWECVENMACNGGWHWKTHLEALYCNRLTISSIDSILENSGLFEIIEGEVVLLASDVMNGIVDFDESVFMECRKSHPWTYLRAEASALVSAGVSALVSAEASAGVSAEASAGPGPSDIEKEREREERRLRLSSLLNRECPHLQLMEEPLTLEEFDDLVMQFGRQAVQDVLLSMENETALNKRSCFKTALSWLRARERKG